MAGNHDLYIVPALLKFKLITTSWYYQALSKAVRLSIVEDSTGSGWEIIVKVGGRSKSGHEKITLKVEVTERNLKCGGRG